MKTLDRVTLILADTKYYGRALYSLKKSLTQIRPARTIFFTDVDIDPGEGIEVIKIPPINSKAEYSRFIVKELYKYIDTEFILISQWDAIVLNGDCWKDEYYDYDVIGAPWLYTDGRNCGNGGGSLRSLKLMTILGADPFIEITDPEDEITGRLYRRYLEEKYDIRFPSDELADTFSFELRAPICKTFMHHSYFHPPYEDTVVITRNAAMGDVVQVEPILFYFFKKGHRVVLETMPQFYGLFIHHYFKVHRPEEVDKRVLATAKKYDLDFSYESKPKQLHLKTYFEYCEVPESEMILRNPILNLNIEKSAGTKLFKKYCVLHLSVRGQPSRNIQGNVDWEGIVKYLNDKGYTVIQIGGSPLEDVKGAVQMMTPGEPFLMWVIREANLFVGVDSGPGNIAVAFNVPAVLFFGSVNPEYIYADLSNVEVIQLKNVCRLPHCWSESIGCEGSVCVEDDPAHPPCVQFSTEQVIAAINNITCK